MPLAVKHVTFDTTDPRRLGADRVAEVERAVALGAAVVADRGSGFQWTVLVDRAAISSTFPTETVEFDS